MYLKPKFLIFLVSFYVCMACAQSHDNMYKSYVAYKTTETVTIDGNVNEESWEKASWSNVFIDIEGVKKPMYQTQVKMIWDEKYFYILAKMEEPHVWGDIKKHDAVIFHNNDFEVFVDPNGDTHNYYELEINALNTIWDLFMTKPYRDPGNNAINDWHITGLKSAVSIDGTLNDASDIDNGWTLEIAIPWSVYKTSYHQNIVPVDKFWRVNFSRVNWNHDIVDGAYSRKKDGKGKYLPEYNWVWSPQGVINMHEPEKWGYVYFSSKEVGSHVTFNIPQDEKVKWEMYKIYRALKKKDSAKKEALPTSIRVEGKTITPVIETHSLGSIISVKSPFSNKTLIIKEDGEFLNKQN